MTTDERTAPLDSLRDLEVDEPGRGHHWAVVLTLVLVLAEAAALGFATHRSGSAVLFAETAQTLAGAGVELFLIIGLRRSMREPDEWHPLGYGREAFFWSLIAAVGIFVGGGAVSIAQGLRSFTPAHTHESFVLGYVVLSVIIVVDAGTLVAAVRPFKRSAIVGRLGLRRGLRHTSDAGTRTLIFDNASAVAGGAIAIAGLAVHQATGDARADAISSLLIGALLLITMVALVHTNRELLTDRSVAPSVVTAMRARVEQQDGIVEVRDLVAVYTGPKAALVTGTVVLDAALDVQAVERTLAECGATLVERWPGTLRVYLAPVPGG